MEQQLQDFQELEGPDQDLPVGGFSPAQNPEPAKEVKKPGLAEHLNDVAQAAADSLSAKETAEHRKVQTVSLKMADGQDLPEHYAAEVKLMPLVLDDGTMYPAHSRPDLPIAEYAVQRRLRDTRFDEFGKTLGNGKYRQVTQTRAKTLEDAQKLMAEYSQRPVQPEELGHLQQENAVNVKTYESRMAERQNESDVAQEKETQQKKAPEQDADPLHLGDIKKTPEHLFPEQPSHQKSPEVPQGPGVVSAPKREFPKKNPPEVLLANPRNNKPHVKDFGDHIVVTRRAMFGAGKAARAKSEQAVTVGLQAAAERFGQPVRFEGNPGFLEETAKQAVKLGIKLEPGNRLAEAIYAKALDARDKEIRIAKQRDMVFSQSKDKEKTKEKGVGLSR